MYSLVKRLAAAATLSAMATCVMADRNTMSLPAPTQPAELHVVVTAGMTSACGLREAPHLIEHMLLSDTRYGDNPVEAMLTLKDEGITLKAFTLLDYTHFTLSGPVSKVELMGEALAEFLGRSSIPRMGFEREKHAILNELRQTNQYVSRGSLFERFVAMHAGGPKACPADDKPLVLYQFAEVDELYRQLYTADSLHLAGVNVPADFDLPGLLNRITQGKAVNKAVIESASTQTTNDLSIIAPPGITEIIFPIQGRARLPNDAAMAIAERMRLEIQAYLRNELGLYSARSFVDQGLSGGWIRLEIPSLPTGMAEEVAAIAQQAATRIDVSFYNDDVVWSMLGGGIADETIMRHIVAPPPADRLVGWRAFVAKVLSFIGIL